MELLIQDNVPLPEAVLLQHVVDKILMLKPKQSFFVPFTKQIGSQTINTCSQYELQRLQSCISGRARYLRISGKVDFKVTTRQVREQGIDGVRIWRV